MADSIAKLARDLRGFNADATVVKALRTEINKPVPAVRKKIRANAIAILPAGGGLGQWVAAGRVTSIVKVAGRTVTVTLKGGRSSVNKKASDFNAIDRGRVRHPSWGRRWEGQWHNQGVQPKFFSGPAGEETEWAKAITAAVDKALEVLSRG
jgi:hypothetical protein